jgi:hypothetical protein
VRITEVNLRDLLPGAFTFAPPSTLNLEP